jgi:hypothetical protein
MSEVDWAALLAAEDVEGLWTGLFKLISRHPSVRPLRFGYDGAAVASATEIHADLTQELFLELFQKNRFEHYVNNLYTAADIEHELARIELPNLVGARMRKRYPESFRMARRISSLLKSSDRFRLFGLDAANEETSASRLRKGSRKGHATASNGSGPAADVEEDLGGMDSFDELEGEPEPGESSDRGSKRRRMVDRVFGLREWPSNKSMGDAGRFPPAVKRVPMRTRDNRVVGRSGISQIILSTIELEKLIVEVLAAIDSPADVRTIRQLVLSKIPIQDYNVASLDEEVETRNSGTRLRWTATDIRDTPEEALLRVEHDEMIKRRASDFLTSLKRVVNNNERRFARMIATLWYCYYDPQDRSQIEIAKLIGVSDSLVSDNRRLLEHELRGMRLSLEDAATFSESLKREIVRCHLSPKTERRSISPGAPKISTRLPQESST